MGNKGSPDAKGELGRRPRTRELQGVAESKGEGKEKGRGPRPRERGRDLEVTVLMHSLSYPTKLSYTEIG